MPMMTDIVLVTMQIITLCFWL